MFSVPINPKSIAGLKAAAVLASACGNTWVNKGKSKFTDEVSIRYEFAAKLQENMNILIKEGFRTLVTIDNKSPIIIKIDTNKDPK